MYLKIYNHVESLVLITFQSMPSAFLGMVFLWCMYRLREKWLPAVCWDKVALYCQTNLIHDAQKPLFQPVNFALGKSGCKHWTTCISLDQDKYVLKRTMKQEKGVQGLFSEHFGVQSKNAWSLEGYQSSLGVY